MTTLKERFGRVDRQLTHAFVQELHNTEMLPGKSGAKFVDRIKSTVKQIEAQNMNTENAIIAVLKAAI